MDYPILCIIFSTSHFLCILFRNFLSLFMTSMHFYFFFLVMSLSDFDSNACQTQNNLKTSPQYFILFLNIFIDYAITVVPFPCLHSTPFCPPPPAHIPPLQFMSMGHAYKFFGFYLSYTILTLPLSIFHLSFMLLILCTFPPSLHLPLPC